MGAGQFNYHDIMLTGANAMKQDGIQDFSKWEAVVKRESFTKHKTEVELMTNLLNTYINGFNLIGSFTYTETNKLEYAWLSMLARSFRSMRCAIWLIAHGYYDSATSLLRGVFENWLLCLDCEIHQPTLDALISSEGEAKNYRFNYKEIAVRTGKLRVYEDQYRFMSKFTHTSSLSLRTLIEHESQSMGAAPFYNETLFLMCCELMIKNALGMTVFMDAFLLQHNKDNVGTWRKLAGIPVEEADDWLNVLRRKWEAGELEAGGRR